MSESLSFPDGFEMVRLLGRGGMGTVYLARDTRLGRLVALKVLSTQEPAMEERRQRFLREARLAAAIRHPNVATIYDVGETGDERPYIVMEYCEGETLSQRIRREKIGANEFVSIARQITAGLAAAHEQGLVHRDIKSANIMLEPSGRVKILDFGLAKSLPLPMAVAGHEITYDSSSGHFFGTLHFISPEQARGGTADQRSDLFSLGIVLYHMASGQLPFGADSPLLVLDRIRESEPDPFTPSDPSFPAAAGKIIVRLLQKNPDDRYQSAGELLADIDLLEGSTLHLSLSTTRFLGRTIRRTHRTRIAITVIAALIVVASVILLQRSGVQEPVAAAAPPPIRSMAVLPLRNIANNAADEFLSVGIADALVTQLQHVRSLRVRPTSAVLEFRDGTDTKAASRQLGVDGVLEGTFLAAGDLVRVTLQLTDTRTGFSIWSDSIDGRRGDLLKLIDQVSQRTVKGLNEQLGLQQPSGSRSEARSTNPRAYEAYLRARALRGSFVPKQYSEHVAALEKAIELDPSFAAAYAELASSISLGHARSLASAKDLERAEWYARQAVRLDPNLPEAHLALGRVFVRNPDRYRESVREVLAALRLSASDTHALHSLVTYFVSTGDLQKAQCVGQRIVSIDPSSNEASMRGYWHVNSVDPEGALQNAQYALASPDTALAGHDMRGMAFLFQGNVAQAEKEADAALSLNQRHYLGRSLKAMTAAARGDRTSALAVARTFERDASANHWAAFRQALVYAKLGDRDRTIQWLRRAVELGNHSWYALVKHPWLQTLQSDPEFQEMVAAIRADLDDVRDDVIGVYQLLCRE